MILDDVKNDQYILQNTLHSNEISPSQNLPLLRISRKKRYYVSPDDIDNCYDWKKNDYIYRGPNKFLKRNEFLYLTNEEQPTMKKEEWYLLPYAYSITLTPN